jgi:hypothetical protein
MQFLNTRDFVLRLASSRPTAQDRQNIQHFHRFLRHGLKAGLQMTLLEKLRLLVLILVYVKYTLFLLNLLAISCNHHQSHEEEAIVTVLDNFNSPIVHIVQVHIMPLEEPQGG